VTLPNRWASQFAWLAVWVVAALSLGAWFGGMGWWLVGALALYGARLLRRLYLLDRVLDGYQRVAVVETRGLWPEMFARVEKIRAKARSRKKKYHRLLREVRESTGALSDGGIILNAENEIVWFNAAATRLLGLSTADVGNRLDNLVRHPDFVAYLAKPTPEPVTVPSPSDESGMLTAQIVPYGKEQRLAIIRDITREIKLERMRRDFVANASHELRSPLTVIGGYLDALADDEAMPSAWRGPIGEMQRQAERMTRILRDLIELSRLESSDRTDSDEVVDVARMLELIAGEFQSPGGERPPVTLELESDASLLGNESELHSIFYNLVNNAVRFTPPTGTVKVAWREDGVGAVFEVTDTGIGIPEEQIPRITERFYRVDPGRSRASGGTGLGLAIVKHALQRHDGTLQIHSLEGHGSTFTCRFPSARVVSRTAVAEAV